MDDHTRKQVQQAGRESYIAYTKTSPLLGKAALHNMAMRDIYVAGFIAAFEWLEDAEAKKE